jgi:adenine-specific DNA-methyltransferase
MLALNLKTPRDFINPLLSKKSINISEFDKFKTNLQNYTNEAKTQHDTKQSEPNIVSNALKPFVEAIGYKTAVHSQKGQSGIDLAIIKNGLPCVIIEAKKHGSNEMISKDNLNRRAFHEAALYFMRERDGDNNSVFHIIVTDFFGWFVFDAKDFDELFWKNKTVKKLYENYKSPSILGDTTKDFYESLERELASFKADLVNDKAIDCAYFNLAEPQNEKNLVAIYKLLSPDTLTKEFNPNDANSLNREFYSELLYILGLEEVKDGGKKLIQRAKAPQDGSLYENIFDKLSQYGKRTDFESIIKLMIIWINRILFLKLLESQIVKWNGKQEYRFLNAAKIDDYDKLEMLFFEILAKKPIDRKHREFDFVPYLNSSLFEIHETEEKGLKISNLADDTTIQYYSKTVIKDEKSNKKTGAIKTLHYLFEFLDAYDFSSEGGEELVGDNKTLINASVLGLIFEKLNGYRDGSFYTPSFITQYMARESLTKAVIDKFNNTKGLNCQNLIELHNKIDDITEANAIIDSLKVCDPAVGSGHFLVSALNEILFIKSELGILCDDEGKRIKEHRITVLNDELIVKDDEGEIFEYKRDNREKSRIQKTLFKEKQKIIENCLFGVDINPNSVNICRLRLWIELLKNAYYREDGTLDTLPNIDINIKCGNSLISRFGLTDELKIKNIKHEIEQYKQVVSDYKENIGSKKEVLKSIDNLKDKFRLTLKAEWKVATTLNAKLKEFVGEYGTDELDDTLLLIAMKNRYGQTANLFGDEPDQKKKAKLLKELTELQAKIDEIESGKIYDEAFEWRFEFPEALDGNGDFVGFDVVIGNPPYGVTFNGNEKKLFACTYGTTDDIYTMFIEKGLNVLSTKGMVSFITPIFWLTGDGYFSTRKLITESAAFIKGISLPYNIFEDAYIDTGIYMFSKELTHRPALVYEFEPAQDVDVAILSRLDFDMISSREWSKNKDLKIVFNQYSRLLAEKTNCFDNTIGGITESIRGILASNEDYSDIQLTNSYKPIFTGKLDRYTLENNFKFVKYGDNLKEKPSSISLFSGERILVRRIVNRQFRIMATISSDEFVTKKDIYIFKVINADFDYRYLLSIINSKLISFLKTRSSTTAKKDDFTQLTLGDIRQIGIPKIDTKDQKPFIDLVDKILELKKSGSDTAALETQIDQMVYKLYSLSEDEIKTIEGEK